MQTTAYRLWLDMAAQRFALMALRRAWTLLGSRKMLVNRAESLAFSAYILVLVQDALLAGVFDFMRQLLDGFRNLFILGNKWIQLSQTR